MKIGAIALLAAALAIAAAAALPGPAPSEAQTAESEARIAARRLADGRVEFALQPRGASGWGERILPARRFFPAAGGSGWLHSSPVTAGGAEARISARRLADGRVEFALQPRGASGWGERILPRQRFFPAAGGSGWLNSSPVVFGEAEPPAAQDVRRFGPVAGDNPAWSPDGRWIAFTSDRDGDTKVYVMDADGSNVRRLTDNTAFWRGGPPAWSPDGQRIAFSSHMGIVVANADGTNVNAHTGGLDGTGYGLAWSPDGQRIAFVMGGFLSGARPRLYVMSADGTDLRLLDNLIEWDEPEWSPDGRIAFVSHRDGFSDIYVVNADGSRMIRLTDDFDRYGAPVWSPDGRRLAFVSKRYGDSEVDWEVYVMNADGSDMRRLTDNESGDWVPAWSPDGRRLAFASDRDGDGEVYVMNADGSDVRRLTDNEAWDGQPAWSPDGNLIAFVSDRDGDDSYGDVDIYVIEP